jgi:hypothetical protein
VGAIACWCRKKNKKLVGELGNTQHLFQTNCRVSLYRYGWQCRVGNCSLMSCCMSSCLAGGSKLLPMGVAAGGKMFRSMSCEMNPSPMRSIISDGTDKNRIFASEQGIAPRTSPRHLIPKPFVACFYSGTQFGILIYPGDKIELPASPVFWPKWEH